MITHINDRLINWATWAEQRLSGALGYPKAAAFTRLGPGGGRFDGTVVLNEDAWEIEQAVTALAPELRIVVKVVYRTRGTVAMQAATCGMSERTLYRRIDQAHAAILDWLLGYYAGRGDGQGERRVRREVRSGATASGAGEAGAHEAIVW